MLRVRAVVMTRDDSSGGWVPMGGGGLSHVTICKVRHPDEGRRHQYLINGERIRDQAVILECALKRDLVYNKVNPIFHHWKVGDSKFGLTFQSPADATAFERGIQAALKEIAEGSLSPSSTAASSASSPDEAAGRDEALVVQTDSESSSNSQKEILLKAITIVTSESSSSCYVRPPIAEEFPFGRGQGRTAAGPQAQPLQQLRPPEEEELESIAPCRDLWVTKGYEDYRRAMVQKHPPDAGKADLCVHFGKGGSGWRSGKSPREYSSPPEAEGRLKDPKASPSCRIHGAASPAKRKLLKEPPGAATTEEDAAPSRCVYCRDVFSHEENGRGQCQDAPDPIGRCVYQFTCVWCAESMLYHCMSDSEGEYSDPCSCDGSHPHFCVRWLALAALSLVVPCMCCYLPLHACYWCGERCGCCGGKHKAVR